MKVLITGITGFVGQHLRRYLPSGHEYFVLARKASNVTEGCKIIQGDLNDLAQVKEQLIQIKPDVCVHLVWEGIPDYSCEISTKNLKNGTDFFRFLVKECGCRKIVAVGSCWEYGKSFGACAETDALAAGSYFVWAKRALCDFGFSLAREEKINFVWLRLFFVYGPGQRQEALIPGLVRALKNKELPQVRTPLDANDFVYVDDAVQALVKTVFSEVPSGIYNIGSGVSVPVWRVCGIIEDQLKSNTSHSEDLRKSQAVQMSDFWANTQLSFDVLGWQAQRSLEDGIKEYLKSQGAQQ
jgi:nucleoside-diphosphate-sugar epimerase